MNTYIDRLATAVMDSDEVTVCHHHARAAHHGALRTDPHKTPHLRRWHRDEEARAILAAVLAWSRDTDTILSVADALAVAHRVAERVAAVAEGATA